ncbi:MAG: class I SAM-dependent methyltransferase [Helicobacteraceae bacterium]|nr:class I SAM-dependent methyltransferase [Helicobacteraceae bacterium]
MGIGDGGFDLVCQEKGLNIYSLDPNANAIERLNKITGKARVGYSSNMPFEDSFFDCVVMSEVIEHLDNSEIAASLDEIERVLKANGRFIGSTPADENLLASVCVCPNCGTHFHKYGHLQSFDKTRLTKLLQGRFVRVSVARKYLADPRLLNKKGKMARLVKTALIKLGVSGEGENFIWEASRRE